VCSGTDQAVLIYCRIKIYYRDNRKVHPLSSRGARKADIRLPGKGNSNSHGARPVHQILSMIKWIRTSMLSIKNSLSLAGVWGEVARTKLSCVRAVGGPSPNTGCQTLNPRPPSPDPPPSTLNSLPATLNPQPSTFNPQTSTLNPQPSTPNPQSSTLNP